MQDHRIPYQLFRGQKIPFRFSVDQYSAAVNYEAQPNDLFLVSYPKTGSTWVQYIIYLILNDGKSPDDVASMISTIPYIQRDGFPQAQNAKPIAFKYQMPFRFVPYSRDSKYIYVARNPKDTCVSFYHFCKSIPGYNFAAGTWDEFFELFLDGDLPFGDYFENLTSWYEHLGEPNFCFVTYEEMKGDIYSIIKKIARFLGKILEERLIDEIAHYSSFQYMKDHVNSHLERYLSAEPGSWKPETCGLDDFTKTKKVAPTLVRKGEIGQWKFFFSVEQEQRIDRAFFNETRFSNARGLWPDIMKHEADDS